MDEISNLPPVYRVPPGEPVSGTGKDRQAPQRKRDQDEKEQDQRRQRRKHDDDGKHIDEYA